MGVVYLAHDERLDRDVAIKALPADFASDPGRLERFEREARSLAQVSHQNIAGIHGVEEQDGQRFLVLEYVEGETLADRLDRGPIEPDEAVELACQIAAGVAAAHAVGVIHRDLKPANIKVTPDGVAKVLDFGLARQDEGQSSTGASEAATLTTPAVHSPTSPGVILGTAAYMSPEQARGRRVDKRTDIWSFGVVLYEMLTGASPFVGETVTDSIGAILHKDPDLGVLPSGTPHDVRRVLARCLERDKARRFQDLGDVRIELEAAASEPAPAGDSHSGRGSGSPMLTGIVGALALAAGLALAWTFKPATNGTHMRLSVAPPAEHVLVRPPAISPDGRTVMFAAAPREGGALLGFLRRIDEHESTPLEWTRGARGAAIDPSGDWVSFIVPIGQDGAQMQLVKHALGTDLPPIPIAVLPESVAISGYTYAWLGPDRFMFADGRANQVRFVDAESGSMSDPVPLDVGDYGGDLDLILGRIDDERALCRLFRYSERGFQYDIAVLDTGAATVTPVIENAGDAAIGPDGSILFTRGSVLYGAPFDLESLEAGSAAQLVAGLRTPAPFDDASFEISADGTIVFSPGGEQGAQRRLEFQSADGSIEVWPGAPRPFDQTVSISPDQSRILTVVVAPTKLYEIWGSELDEPRMRRVRGVGVADLNYPVFGPDNDSFAYMIAEEGDTGVEIASFDGRFEPRLIVEPVEEGLIAPIDFHPSGNRVLLMWERPEGARLYEAPTDGSSPPRLILGNDSNKTWSGYSPDGTMLAYTSDETGRREVYLRTIDDDGSFGRAIPVTTRGARGVTWWNRPSRDSAAPGQASDIQRLAVITNDGFITYPVTPGVSPMVGEAERLAYDQSRRSVGFGAFLSDGRFMTIAPGENESPATHAEIIINWYDEASKLIRGE